MTPSIHPFPFGILLAKINLIKMSPKNIVNNIKYSAMGKFKNFERLFYMYTL